MFILGVPILEKILRPIIVYVFLIAGLRLSGKRELAQLNPFDLVVLLTLSNTVQNAIIGEDNSVTGGIIGAISLLAINYLVVRFLYDHRKIDQIVEGRLSEVRQCVLEPGGTLTFIARKPDTEDIRHAELMKKFDLLAEEIARLRKMQPPATA